MEKGLYIFFSLFITYFVGRYALLKYKNYRLNRQVWKKGYEEASSVDSLTVVQLVDAANKRESTRRDNKK